MVLGYEDELVSALQLQRRCYVLENVPLEMLGHPLFVKAASEWRICGLSVGSRGGRRVLRVLKLFCRPSVANDMQMTCLLGLGGDSSLALLGPCGRLAAALTAPSFQRLGLEEPLPGALRNRSSKV